MKNVVFILFVSIAISSCTQKTTNSYSELGQYREKGGISIVTTNKGNIFKVKKNHFFRKLSSFEKKEIQKELKKRSSLVVIVEIKDRKPILIDFAISGIKDGKPFLEFHSRFNTQYYIPPPFK